ncbi:MAG: outer membrane lipoprotein carrier protein LolA [Elusimicrobia bacterium]|nr:outer membrane lipoprotein carrier protein LolA [Elusimicrobiota bacterium]
MSAARALLLAAVLAAGARAAPAPTAAEAIPLQPPTTGPITVDLVVERLESLDSRMRSLSAAFVQSVRSEASGSTQVVSGTFAYRKKNLMRIEHLVPDRQTLVCDGTKVWVWRPANDQVVRSSLEAWKKSQPLAQGLLDFGNYAQLLKRYDVSVATVSAPDARGYREIALALSPRAPQRRDAGTFGLTLRLSTRDFFPRETELRLDGTSARTVFSDVRFNPRQPDDLFRFAPPAGADILDFPSQR